jgi:predicted O-methyltransferase YrrM
VIDETTLIYGKPRGHYSEADWTPPREDCPHPENWTCADGDSTEHQVTELVAAFVRATQPELAVETGAAFGDTTVAIGEALAMNAHGRLVSLEVDGDRAEFARARCVGLSAEVFEVDSLDWNPPGPIGFAWFDSLPELRVPEFMRYRPFMEPGTIVGFHDCAPHRPVLRAELFALMGEGYIRGIMPRTPRGVCFAEVL